MKPSRKPSRKRLADPLSGDLSKLLQEGKRRRIRFELAPKDKTVTIRMSADLLKAVKRKAARSGLDYQKFIRLALEERVS